MTEIDPLTGLPKELGTWEDIAKENQNIEIYIEKKKFGKKYTVIEGIDNKEIDIKKIRKDLKNQLACGGTDKGGKIELQGDHRKKVKEILIKLGFAEETMTIR